MSEDERSVSLPLPIKDAPHWRVNIRPGNFESERIPTLGECWEMVNGSRVSLRGWDYPHVDRQHQAQGRNWIASWSEFRSHREYWRFYQSGQFLHLLSFQEDAFRARAEQRAKVEIYDWPDDFTPSGYLEVVMALWTITEVFEFAARLAARGILGASASVGIEMVDIKDRVLFILDPGRWWDGLYAASKQTLGKSWPIDKNLLLTNSSDLALDASVWFFERFGWLEIPRDILANDQRRLLEKRF